jgi:polar amino acid transport system substrate-binding protein
MPAIVATPASSPKGSGLAGLVTPDVLTIGSYANYFPQEYVDPTTHQVTGFDIELIRAIARQLGLKAVIVTANFQALEPNLLANKYDAVISAVSIMPQVDKKVRFIPYFVGGESLLVKKGSADRIDDLTDLCGKTVAVKRGTIEQNELQDTQALCKGKSQGDIHLFVVDSYQDGLQVVSQNKVFAMYQDSPLTDYFCKHYADKYQIGSATMGTNVEGIMVRGNDSVVSNALRKAFAELRASGAYHRMIEEWGLVDGELAGG